MVMGSMVPTVPAMADAMKVVTLGADLSDEQKKQVEFVQFHPSYDYSDFVEGLRPRMNEDGSMGFELQDGIFKKFVDRARKNFEDSKKSKELVEQEISAKTAMTDFFGSIELIKE